MRRGGQGDGLQVLQAAGHQEHDGQRGHQDAPYAHLGLGGVEVAVVGVHRQHERGGVGGGDEERRDEDQHEDRHDEAQRVILVEGEDAHGDVLRHLGGDVDALYQLEV